MVVYDREIGRYICMSCGSIHKGEEMVWHVRAGSGEESDFYDDAEECVEIPICPDCGYCTIGGIGPWDKDKKK